MRASSVAAALFLVNAAIFSPAWAAEQRIPLADGADELIVPANSPVHYRFTGKDDDIHFAGRFVLTGTYYYGCAFDCDESDRTLQFVIVPDAELQARLPHWRQRNGELGVYLNPDRKLVSALISRRQLALVRAGKLDAVSGRASIVADNFVAEIDCDSPNYSADFRAVLKPLRVAALSDNSKFGC